MLHECGWADDAVKCYLLPGLYFRSDSPRLQDLDVPIDSANRSFITYVISYNITLVLFTPSRQSLNYAIRFNRGVGFRINYLVSKVMVILDKSEECTPPISTTAYRIQLVTCYAKDRIGYHYALPTPQEQHGVVFMGKFTSLARDGRL